MDRHDLLQAHASSATHWLPCMHAAMHGTRHGAGSSQRQRRGVCPTTAPPRSVHALVHARPCSDFAVGTVTPGVAALCPPFRAGCSRGSPSTSCGRSSPPGRPGGARSRPSSCSWRHSATTTRPHRSHPHCGRPRCARARERSCRWQRVAPSGAPARCAAPDA